MAQIRLPVHSYRFCSGQSYMCPQSITINLGLESEIGQDRPHRHPTRLGTSPRIRGVIWAHSQIPQPSSEAQTRKSNSVKSYTDNVFLVKEHENKRILIVK